MRAILIGWVFCAFIYFKVAFEAAFSSGITILAAFLMSIIMGGVVFLGSGAYAAKLLRYNWTPGAVPVGYRTLISKTLLTFLGVYLAFGVLSRLIIFGFSNRLSDSIEVFRYRFRIDEDFVSFSLIVAVPVILHWVMCLVSTHATANLKEQDIDL